MGRRHFDIPIYRRRRSVSGGLVFRPGTGVLNWAGYPPNASGVTWYIPTGFGAATWDGFAPSAAVGITTGVGQASWTGPSPTVVGLVPATALEWGSGNVLYWGSDALTWGT